LNSDVVPVHAQTEEVVNDIVQYIAQAGDAVGIACYPVGNPDGGIHAHADERFPLASTIKIMILGVYAEGVASGKYDPEERVSLADLDAYYLPGTDGGAHPTFLKAVTPDENSTISLSDIVYGMIRYSSNAAADYLHARMTDADFEAFYKLLGIENTDIPVSLLGLFLAQDNHETGISDATLSRDEMRASTTEWANEYVSNAKWRLAERVYHRQNTRRYLAAGKSIIDTQRIFFEKYDDYGTPSDFAKVMAALQRGDTLPATTSVIMHAALSWPMQFDDNRAIFFSLGTKGGSLPGILTSAYFAHPKQNEPVVLVVFYSDLTSDRYLNWLHSFDQQQYEWYLLEHGCSSLSS
jgi:beta-lactamase class A